jgi:hypothetical protein
LDRIAGLVPPMERVEYGNHPRQRQIKFLRNVCAIVEKMA